MESYNFENERIAIDYLSGSFVKIPRKILIRMISKVPFERRVGWFHLLLIVLSFHTDGFVMLNGRKVACWQGEYVGSYRGLSEISGYSITTVSRLLKKLIVQNLIVVMRLEGGTRIRVCGYRIIFNPPESGSGKPPQCPVTPPDKLSEASKKMIMRETDAIINLETQFF